MANVTNRELLFLQLSHLPASFRSEVDQCFGGLSLMERAAASLAERLVQDGTHVAVLREAGYPAEIVSRVKQMMCSMQIQPVQRS